MKMSQNLLTRAKCLTLRRGRVLTWTPTAIHRLTTTTSTAAATMEKILTISTKSCLQTGARARIFLFFCRSLICRIWYRQWHSWKKGIHPIAVKLHEALTTGVLPADHVFALMVEQGLDLSLRQQSSHPPPFQWDPRLLSFWETVKFYIGKSGVNLLRGPGLHGRCKKGTDKTRFSWCHSNLPIPGASTLARLSPGSTTKPGVVRDLLVASHRVLADPARKTPPLVTNASVSVFGVAVAGDGFSLKPGLQLDMRSGTVVGMVGPLLDLEYVLAHPVLDHA